MRPDGTLNIMTKDQFEEWKKTKQRYERLLAETNQDGRICPKPAIWHRLWELLPDRQRNGQSWLPTPPLILAAWGETSDQEKRDRFEYHLHWAFDHGAIDAIAQFLAAMKPEDWYTGR
jgi:hypothetical protein